MKKFIILFFFIIFFNTIFSIDFTKDTFKYETDKIKIIYEYPMFKEEKFNEVNGIIKEKIRNMFEKDYGEIVKISKEDTFFQKLVFFSDLSCSIFGISNDYVSIRFYNESYTGGAHPVHYYFPFNFDLNSKKEVDLKEYYKLKKDRLKKLADFCEKDIKNQMKENITEDVQFSIPLDFETFKVFNINENGIYFTFNEYSILPYYLGSYTVFIPKEKFLELIK